MDNYEIYVPSAHVYIVQHNKHMVPGWMELQEQARQETEPLVRERWQAYWLKVAQYAASLYNEADLFRLMTTVQTPGMYYPCSPELAARAQAIMEEK
jgi:hypothetical protein